MAPISKEDLQQVFSDTDEEVQHDAADSNINFEVYEQFAEAERDEESTQSINPLVSITLEQSTFNGEDCVDVFADGFVDHAWSDEDEKNHRHRKAHIARVTRSVMWQFPVNVQSYRDDFLTRKYELTSIAIMGSFSPLPHNAETFNDLLSKLPIGFSRYAWLGLGLKYDYRFIADEVSEIEGVTELVIDPNLDEVACNPPAYSISLEKFNQLRRALDRIVERARREALEDRYLLAYNSLRCPVNQELYPPKYKEIKPGSIYQLVQLGAGRNKSNKADQQAMVAMVEANSKELVKTAPKELLALKSVIEKVALDELIEKIETMLPKSLKEAQWQQFFKDNPFILSLCFPHPVLLVQGEANVGGARYSGVGEKIADFLVAQKYTGNLALIEIKKPTTPLLSTSSYREDVYGPHSEVSGAITQVLDQRFQLQNNFTNKAYSSGWLGIHPFSVQCVLIAGVLPTDKQRIKSLDLFRHASKDVTLVTFDELLDKLKQIQSIITCKTEIAS